MSNELKKHTRKNKLSNRMKVVKSIKNENIESIKSKKKIESIKKTHNKETSNQKNIQSIKKKNTPTNQTNQKK